MSKFAFKVRQRKQSLQRLFELEKQLNFTYIIHYSCESFKECLNEKSPRITSIAVRNIGTGETKSFSIHDVAEEKSIEFVDIIEQYDTLEKAMLDNYFNFLKGSINCNFLHWNMRDGNFGFSAIEHRYKVLKGEPYVVPERNKIDLSREFIKIYGDNYIGHTRLIRLAEKNYISQKDLLEGEEEALSFKKQEYIKMHRSTLRKVDILHSFFDKACSNTLITEEKIFRDRYQNNIFYFLDEALESFWGRSFIALCSILGLVYTLFSN